jgi:type I restriction enzyme, S subunit
MSDSANTEATVYASAPSGWVWAKFDDICEPVSDGGRKVPQKAYLKSGQYPIVDQGEELIGGFTDDPTMLFQGKTPVIAFGDHTRRFKLIDWPFVVGADGVKLIGPTAAWNAKCLWYFLCALKFEDRGYSRHFQFLRKSLLPLPPFPEQTRIADALDELFSDLDAGVAALTRVREKLKLYRASVLKAAVEGALTAEWRAEHPHAEPASELLQRILAERRRRWEEEQLAKFKAKDQEPPNNWKAKYMEPVAPDTTNLPPLPEGWCWVSLAHLTPSARGSVKTGPFGSLLKKYEHQTSGVPVLGIENIDRMRFVRGSKIHISQAKANDLAEYDAKPGDVLISRSGTVGEVCVVPEDIGVARISTNLMRVRLNAEAMTPYFFCLLFNGSPAVLSQVSSLCSGSTRDFLNNEILAALLFPLPPLPEQEAIVELVEDQLSISEHLEADLDAKVKNAQALRQAILRYAFTGQLVPQDPNDEPASILLKRIAAEREQRAREAAAAKRAGKQTNGPRTGRRGRLKRNHEGND